MAEPDPSAANVPSSRNARRPVAEPALAHQRRRLNRAEAPPWLHGEVARRMAERLSVVRLQPKRVLDWGAFLGASQAVLGQAYPKAQWLGLESDTERHRVSAAALQQPWWSPRRWAGAAPALVEGDAPAPGAAELLWANMHLHLEADPQALMRRWQQALAVDGFLMFSTLGPGSLSGLAAVYAEAGWPPPFAPFVDMHDLGDMLIEAGFADPVMDQEILTLTWASADALLAELRGLGGNADARRHPGLRTPRWRERLAAAINARAGADGRVSLAFEIVYGHAFRPPPRPRVAAETAVALEDLRTMARAGRKPA
ncbi:Biotin synthase [Rubrivivax sp. A210]|uniref:biotin synthase n=1 Tax=Rubrivivax sp. A210 TaxID=2772301 RepID=UPI00191AA60F|nr:biotin synthase [Rubrivivax sp. A210]CAD5372670.1 Biotin synthase [Rubrivivax sp. A210]